MTKLSYDDRGREAYACTLAVQEQLVQAVAQSPQDTAHLLLVEHDPPVITLGRSANAANVLAPTATLEREGITIHQTARGGDVTYHGPGQLVAYPILRINQHAGGAREYLRLLEQAIIGTLSEFGIEGRREAGYTGVWVGQEKVAAIGVAIRRWVSYHGLALNVCPNLAHFGLIVPCGITDKKVTSMTKLLGREVQVDEVKPVLAKWLTNVLGFEND